MNIKKENYKNLYFQLPLVKFGNIQVVYVWLAVASKWKSTLQMEESQTNQPTLSTLEPEARQDWNDRPKMNEAGRNIPQNSQTPVSSEL